MGRWRNSHPQHPSHRARAPPPGRKCGCGWRRSPPLYRPIATRRSQPHSKARSPKTRPARPERAQQRTEIACPPPVAARGPASAPVSAGVSALRRAGAAGAWAAGPRSPSEAGAEEAAQARSEPEAAAALAAEAEAAPRAGAPPGAAAGAPPAAQEEQRSIAARREPARRLERARIVRAALVVRPAAPEFPRAQLRAGCRRPLLPAARAASAAPDRRSRARRHEAR